MVRGPLLPVHAPPGTALVSSSLPGTDEPGTSDAVLRRLADLHGTGTSGRHRVTAYTVVGALPAMPPPRPLSRTTRFGPGRHVCGDHRATGSVQGAPASGTRAAQEALTGPAPGATGVPGGAIAERRAR